MNTIEKSTRLLQRSKYRTRTQLRKILLRLLYRKETMNSQDHHVNFSWLESRASDREVAGLMPVLGITSLYCPWERR